MAINKAEPVWKCSMALPSLLYGHGPASHNPLHGVNPSNDVRPTSGWATKRIPCIIWYLCLAERHFAP